MLDKKLLAIARELWKLLIRIFSIAWIILKKIWLLAKYLVDRLINS